MVGYIFKAAESDDLETVKMRIERHLEDPYAIFHAAGNNDLETVKVLIENHGVSPLIVGKGCGDSLAHVAAREGNLAMLKYLLEKDSSLLKIRRDSTRYRSDGPSILEDAVSNGHLDIVKYLVEVHNDDIFSERCSGEYTRIWFSPVDLAASNGHLDIVKYFIEDRHVDPNTASDGRHGPLLFSAIRGEQPNITRYLIEDRKANLTVLDENNENILFPAAYNSDWDLIKNVLDVHMAEIDINWRDNNGRTLLYMTLMHDNVDILKYLVEQKHADVNIPRDYRNSTPLQEAIFKSSFAAFKYLVENGADLVKRDEDGNTLLHLAACYNRSEFCKYLLEHGANVKAKNKKGETPLQMAMAENNLNEGKCLIDFSGDVNEKNDDGETLLHVVASYDQIDLLDYLVNEKHAQVNVTRDKDHWTPLHCAAARGHRKICEYLIKHGADLRAKDKMGRSPAQVASDKALIDYIQKAAEAVRSRRSADHSFWIPAQRSEPNIRTHRLTGEWHVEERASANEIEAFHLHNMLAFTNFVIRYMFPSSVHTPRIEVNDNLASNAESLHIAEDAVHTFLDFEEEELA